MTITDVLKMSWGGDRNMALWGLFGGMQKAQVLGISRAFVTHTEAQATCDNDDAITKAKHIFGAKRSETFKTPDGKTVVWRNL